jgi:protein-tyrosine-phosphatase/DNA-binding transcriptional ArsR family regulator
MVPTMANTREAARSAIPLFMELAGHPIRWGLLRELAGSDLRVRELSARLNAPQNLVSYHLGRLRSAKLVKMRRSSADGRDAYYSVDLARCRDLLAESGAALHPGLTPGHVPQPTSVDTAPSVLFACTGNSARSQMAEALFSRAVGIPVRTVSAGSHPKPLHANAVRVLGHRGIDISGWTSKSLDEFSASRFDYVVTLCDKVREVCPEFPGNPRVIHWSLADPAAEGQTDADTYPAFEQLAQELDTRISFLVELLKNNPKNSKGS